MKGSSHPRRCPACGHNFIPWRLWLVSRWTVISCPGCKVRLNRRFDYQFLAIGLATCVLLATVPFMSFLSAPLGWQIAVGLLGLLVIWVFDVITVRLVEAGGWRGIRGYAADEE